jgi:hypothetical protein
MTPRGRSRFPLGRDVDRRRAGRLAITPGIPGPRSSAPWPPAPSPRVVLAAQPSTALQRWRAHRGVTPSRRTPPKASSASATLTSKAQRLGLRGAWLRRSQELWLMRLNISTQDQWPTRAAASNDLQELTGQGRGSQSPIGSSRLETGEKSGRAYQERSQEALPVWDRSLAAESTDASRGASSPAACVSSATFASFGLVDP